MLRFVPTTPLPSLDPIVATGYVIRNHGYMIYDTLFATDETLAVRPQMVEHWDTSADGVWRFQLRPGLVFHDGQAVSSADCIASIKRWAVRDTFGQSLAAAVESYRAVDAQTFEIRLKQAFPLMTAALGKLSSNVPFIMPERVANTDPFRPLTEAIGSGPYRFLQQQWVPGQTAIYERFAQYKPREEAASWAAGGKVAKIDRIEWLALTEPAAAVDALIKGEVDWYEQPPVDLLPLLRKNKDVLIRNVPLGNILLMRFNQLQPPFDNPKVRQAVLMAVKQTDYMQAVVGSPDYYQECRSFFPAGTPLSTGAGSEAMGGDLDKGRALLRDSGYKGERVVILGPADQPYSYNQALVTLDLLKKMGMNAELVTMDWGTLLARVSNRNGVDQGGWSIFHTPWSCADILNPATHVPLRQNGSAGWFGWPGDPESEQLRSAWLATDHADEQKAIAQRIERRAFETVPYVPTGTIQQPMAFRDSLSGLILAPVRLFWNVEKT